MLTQNWLNKFGPLLFSNKSLALAGLFCFVTVFSGCDLYSQRIFSKPLVRVEEQALNVQGFSKLLARRLKDLDPLSAKDPLILKKFKDRIVSDFIVDSLIEIWFLESNLTINNMDLNKKILNETNNYPSDASFRSALAEVDMSYDDWANSVRLTMKREMLFAELRKKIDTPSDSEVLNYYESNKAKYFQKDSVLVKSILISDESQVDVIKKLSKKLTFEKLIQDYSVETPKPKDGIYAWVERDSIADLEILFTNKKNDLIGPVKMNEGLRLFRVVQKRSARQKTLEEVLPQIKNDIVSLRETARFSAWLDEQIKRYTVYKNDLAIDAISIETREE